jgi:ubiquinone/menaquinone biosynthesis C-methylase UbiE
VARRRLPLETSGWDFHAERLLDRIGIQQGWSCLDLGCGPAGLLAPLSRRVGPGGFIVGVDHDAGHLQAARALVREARLTNVEILKRDLYNTRLPRAAFDFVHGRLAAGGAPRNDELLAEMLALTRPGGVVALECVAWCSGTQARRIEVWGNKSAPLRDASL